MTYQIGYEEALDLIKGRMLGNAADVTYAWQYLIDTGMVWHLGPKMAKGAIYLIENGVISLPTEQGHILPNKLLTLVMGDDYDDDSYTSIQG